MPVDPDLYERDFFRWTQDQARLLREEAQLRSNAPLDWLNLAEEIASVGLRDKRELGARLATITEHLLKLEHSPALDPRRGWRSTVTTQRGEIEQILGQSPSLRRSVTPLLKRRWPEARRRGAHGLEGEVDPRNLPRECPYTAKQVLDHDFWPAAQPVS